MIKKCIICGKTFISKYPNGKYCSALCKELANINKRTAQREEKRKYIREYMRKYRRMNLKRTRPPQQALDPENKPQSYQMASASHGS